MQPLLRVISTFLNCSEMPGVFYPILIHGLGFFICFIDSTFLKTKDTFFVFYTLIKHGFLTNQSWHRVLSIIIIINQTPLTPSPKQKSWSQVMAPNDAWLELINICPVADGKQKFCKGRPTDS